MNNTPTPLSSNETTVPTLLNLESLSAQQGKHTHWMRWPGYTKAHLSNGKILTIPEGENFFEYLKNFGVDTSAYEARVAAKLKELSYPPIPTGCEFFQHNLCYEKPIKIEKWEWNITFGRWAALVTFADGWRGYSYPLLAPATADCK